MPQQTPVARVITIPEGWSQAKQRALAFFYDQHKDVTYTNPDGERLMVEGRPYWTWVEKPVNGAVKPMPVGPLVPLGWQAPWHAPERYITKSIGRMQGHRHTMSDAAWAIGMNDAQRRFTIDYVELKREDEESLRAYYELAMNEATRLKEPLPRYGQRLSPELELIVGKPPRHPKIAEAAMGGNKWLLGQQVPVWNEAHQRMEVPEDVPLARLLRMHTTTLATPWEAEAEVAEREDELAMMKEQMAQQTDMMSELKAELARMKADREAREAKQQASADRMAKARAARGTKGKTGGSVPSGSSTGG